MFPRLDSVVLPRRRGGIQSLATLVLLPLFGLSAVPTQPWRVVPVETTNAIGQRDSSVTDTERSRADRLAENKALVRRLIETTNSGGSTDRFFAPEVQHRQNGRTILQDADVRRRLSERRRESFVGRRREIKQLIAEGDLVAAHVTFHGRHVGEYRGIPATGRDVSYDGVHVYRIVNGRIVEASLVTEDFWIVEQLGGVIRPQER